MNVQSEESYWLAVTITYELLFPFQQYYRSNKVGGGEDRADRDSFDEVVDVIGKTRAFGALASVLVAICTVVAPMSVVAQDGLGGSSYTPPDRGEPDLSVHLPDDEVTPGTIERLEFEIRNDADVVTGSGEGVTTARGVTVEITDSGPFSLETGGTSIGPVQDGASVPATQQVAVPDDLEPGTYDIRVELSYSYNSVVGTDGSVEREHETERHTVSLEVADEPRFEVTDVVTAVEPGATGPAAIEITNTGTAWANETRASIAGGTGVTIDGGTPEAPAEELVGDLEPNESKRILVDVAIDGAVSAGEKPIEVEFTYRDGDGVERQAQPETAALAPGAEQSFAIEDVAGSLSVGFDGEITGTVINEGPRAIDDAVLIVEPMSESLFVEDTRYALPALEPGETTAFSYPTDVSGQADPGPRQLRFSAEYTGAGGETTLTDGPVSERVVVDDRVDEFSIADGPITVRQGETTEFTLEITNERDRTLSNVDARLHADSPLSTSNDEAYVPELEPGESAEITFDVTASQRAATEFHPVELDFEYETERGETIVSDVYQHPIDVEAAAEDDGGGITGTLVGVMTLLTVTGIGVGMWWRRTDS